MNKRIEDFNKEIAFKLTTGFDRVIDAINEEYPEYTITFQMDDSLGEIYVNVVDKQEK
jgi:uncharacterized FlaG/YvyC family protein